MKTVMTMLSILLGTALGTFAAGNPSTLSRDEYIDNWKHVAIEHMTKFKIPASIILAQGILESGCGNSELATVANNHFGIKCHDWMGDKYYYDDDAKQECFRKYENPIESYADHAEFLTKRPRYKFLFELNPHDYKGWAYGLKKAGYATNPKYPELLIKIIEDSRLYVYDENPAYLETPMVRIDKTPAQKSNTQQKASRTISTDEVTIYLDRKIDVSDNRIKFIEAKAGDTPSKIAKDLNMGLWQVLKYNDLDRTSRLSAGDMVYIQPKRRKARLERHTIKSGENLHVVSQLYGIKLSRLYKLNKLEENAKVPEGFVVKLR